LDANPLDRFPADADGRQDHEQGHVRGGNGFGPRVAVGMFGVGRPLGEPESE